MDLFKDILAEYYLIIKAAHLVAVMSWMAGLLYLPRLFVYHVDAPVGSQQSETFKIMERRLLKAIMTPAMLLTFIFGILLVLVPGVLEAPSGWFHIKFLLVIVLAGLHGMMAKSVKVFAKDQNQKSALYFRILNEGPTLIMIAVIFLVVVKPF